jgi:hypothetical protein
VGREDEETFASKFDYVLVKISSLLIIFQRSNVEVLKLTVELIVRMFCSRSYARAQGKELRLCGKIYRSPAKSMEERLETFRCSSVGLVMNYFENF